MTGGILHVLTSASVLALQQSQKPGGITALIIQLLPIIFIFGLLYFLFIRPQVKQQREHRALIERLKVGDKIITTSGFYGTIVGVSDKTFKVRLSDKVTVVMDKNAVAGLQQPGESTD